MAVVEIHAEQHGTKDTEKSVWQWFDRFLVAAKGSQQSGNWPHQWGRWQNSLPAKGCHFDFSPANALLQGPQWRFSLAPPDFFAPNPSLHRGQFQGLNG